MILIAIEAAKNAAFEAIRMMIRLIAGMISALADGILRPGETLDAHVRRACSPKQIAENARGDAEHKANDQQRMHHARR